MPVDALHRLGLAMPGVVSPSAEGITIRGRGADPRGLSVRLLLDGSNPGGFARSWSGVEPHNPGSTMDLAGRAEARRVARERLQTGRLGDFIWPVATAAPDHRFAMLNDILVPAFFDEHPGGQIHLVECAPGFNRSLALLSILQRANILKTADPATLQAYLGKSAMSTFGLNVPAEALFSALTFGLSWSYPTLPGFVGTCGHERFLVFLLETPYEVETPDATSFERMLPNMLNIMGERIETSPLAPPDYVPPPLTRPLDRRRFTVDEMATYLRAYVDALGETFAWLGDLDNYGKEAEPDVLDVDFAQATWLTFFVLLAVQFEIITSRVHFARKFAFFDSLELYTALVTSNFGAQTNTWISLASDAHARQTLVPQLSRFGAVGAELAQSVAAIRDRASDVVTRGLLYPRDAAGNVLFGGSSLPIDAFEPKLYRELRNTRHGFAIRNAAVLNVHTGDISNDLPDLSLAMFLGLLADKTPFTLKRA